MSTFFQATPRMDDVRMIETTDLVQGGPGGAVNIALQALVNRTALLKEEAERVADKLTDDYLSLRGGTITGNLTVTGTVTAAQVHNSVYNDYAEFFPRGGETQVGDIIALDESADTERYVRATADSKLVVGVHSEDFAHIIGGEKAEKGESVTAKNLPKYIPVALAGRVMVRFEGKAETGGYVVPSEKPGVGRLATGKESGNVVGRIVKDDGATEERLIKIIVERH